MKKIICAGVVAALLSSGAFATLHVSNLPYDMDSNGLKDLFSTYGEVQSARIIVDRETQRSSGFGFVRLSDPGDETQAIADLNDVEVNGRAIKVEKAPERPSRPSRRR